MVGSLSSTSSGPKPKVSSSTSSMRRSRSMRLSSGFSVSHSRSTTRRISRRSVSPSRSLTRDRSSLSTSLPWMRRLSSSKLLVALAGRRRRAPPSRLAGRRCRSARSGRVANATWMRSSRMLSMRRWSVRHVDVIGDSSQDATERYYRDEQEPTGRFLLDRRLRLLAAQGVGQAGEALLHLALGSVRAAAARRVARLQSSPWRRWASASRSACRWFPRPSSG